MALHAKREVVAVGLHALDHPVRRSGADGEARRDVTYGLVMETVDARSGRAEQRRELRTRLDVQVVAEVIASMFAHVVPERLLDL
jgi:hypothetical protein